MEPRSFIDKKSIPRSLGVMGEVFNGLFQVIQESAMLSWEGIQTLSQSSPRFLSVLNGIIGDTLEEQKSRLAIPMTMLGAPQGDRLCVLVHGLCDSEETWRFPDEPEGNYGSLFQRELGYSPLYLRYNSGLHISTNGRLLAGLLSEIQEDARDPIQEIIFIGHSMGGLVVRSACHYGQEAKAPWVGRVKKIFLLGAPHLGTDFEKIGNLTSSILKWIPNPITKGISVLGNKRSAGIKDLRFGYLLDEDWMEQDADALWKDNRHPVPLLEGVDHYLIAANLAKQADNFFAKYFGDGLITSRSAAGRSFRKSKTIPFTPEHFKIIKGLSHTALARHIKVYEQLRLWCTEKKSA